MADRDEKSELSYAAERCDLLLKIKSTVDGLLANGSNVTWSTYGGLSRISDNVEQILMHGCRAVLGTESNKSGIVDLFNSLKEISKTNSNEKEDNDNGSIKQWIQKSLLNHALSLNLDKFVGSKSCIKHYYYKFAFVRSQVHFQALQLCLRAIEEDNPLLPTTIQHILLNKQRYMEEFRKRLSVGSSNVEGSSSEYTSATEDPVNGDDVSNETVAVANENREKEFEKTSESDEPDFFAINDEEPDNFFLPKSSRLDSMKSRKQKPKFNETILATAAYAAATKPLDVQNEIRWFEGEVIETTPFGIPNGSKTDNLENTNTESNTKLRRPSSESLSSTSTIDSLPFDTKIVLNNENKVELSEHDKKKKLGHYRSKSDQLRRLRPFGSSKPIDQKAGNSSKDDGDTLSSSLPTNSDVAEFYGGGVGSPAPSRLGQPAIIGFLSRREYDSCHEFDRENAHFSISEALIAAIEQMKCETVRNSDQEDDDDDDGSDEEILQLRAQIKKKKMLRKQHSRGQRLLSTDAYTRSSSTPTKSTDSSLSSGSPHSSYSRDPPKSTDSDYNSSGELSSPQCIKTPNAPKRVDVVPSGNSLDTSSLEINNSPISAEQVALCLLQKVASEKKLSSSELKWMVSEQDVPQSLLPLPTAVPVSPDDELYNTSDGLNRRTSLPCRLRGNLEWAPPRQQIIFSIPPNPRRKELMTKQGYRCAGCGMRVDPGYMKRFRYCNYLGKYFCNTCQSTKSSVIPARIIQRWDFREYDVSNFARDLLTRVKNDPLFNIMAVNKTLYKRIKELDEIRLLRTQLLHLVSFLGTCRYGEKLLAHVNTLQGYVIKETHLYSIHDLLEVKSGVFRERLDRMVKQVLEHVSSCQLCLAKGFVCEYCKNGNDILYPFEVKRCSQCPTCRACYHRECFVKEKCPRCERRLLRKKAAEESLPNYDSADELE